tara:strand:+ start:3807 stop:4538 length:732 start_codon:yes stop_codon:yes gene_type:complete
MPEKHIIAMWSGPRNLSTAMMRSFENRADTEVWDEPFYPAYLKDTGLPHPMAAEVMAAGNTNWSDVVKTCLQPDAAAPVFYQKHMTHHMLTAYDRKWIGRLSNAFLIRDPARVVASYGRKHGDISLADIGFTEQAALFDLVCDLTGKAPPVLDATDIRRNPEAALRSLCTALGLEFSQNMLSWPAGRRVSDGVWATHWYDSVINSTGFAPPEQTEPDVPDMHRSIVDAAMPIYAHMKQYAVTT